MIRWQGSCRDIQVCGCAIRLLRVDPYGFRQSHGSVFHADFWWGYDAFNYSQRSAHDKHMDRQAVQTLEFQRSSLLFDVIGYWGWQDLVIKVLNEIYVIRGT